MSSPRDPEELGVSAQPTTAEISSRTTVGAVHLTVSDIERSAAFYRGAVGLEIFGLDSGRASLGAGGRDLLVLVEERGAAPAVGFTGLYHFALLLPRRVDLARWLAYAALDRAPLVGLSDHFVSEALYLSDPDGHGIEIYWDRPREVWEGRVAARMTTQPLDVDDLLGELADPRSERFDGLPAGTVMGHVHLRVASIPETVSFYRDTLGFALMAQLGARGVPRRRWLSTPHRRQHVGELGRSPGSGGDGRAAAGDDRAARRRRARPGRRASRGAWPRTPRGRRGHGAP